LPRVVFAFTDGTHQVKWAQASNPGFSFRFYGVASGGQFVQKHCPWVHPAYLSLRPVAFKADLFRYCALWAFGGVYMDHDLWLASPLSRLFPDDAPGAIVLTRDRPIPYRVPAFFGLHITRRQRVQSSFLAAKLPRQRLFKCAMDQIKLHTEQRTMFDDMTEFSGPAVVASCLRQADNVAFRFDFHSPQAGTFMARGTFMADPEREAFVEEKIRSPDIAPHYFHFVKTATSIYGEHKLKRTMDHESEMAAGHHERHRAID